MLLNSYSALEQSEGKLLVVDEDLYLVRSQVSFSPDRQCLGAVDNALFFLIMSIRALSAKNSTREAAQMNRLSAKAYRQAWTMMQQSISSPTETSLQVLLHMYARLL